MNLKELREKNKLTQAGFAEPLGVSGKSIYLIESGRMKLSKKLSDKIAEVYGEVIEPAERKAGTFDFGWSFAWWTYCRSYCSKA